MICLDTNVIIAILAGHASQVRSRVEEALVNGQALATSSVVLFELWYGAAKSARREGNAKKIKELLDSPIHILDFDAADAAEAGDIRAVLRRKGTPIGPYDVLIAAQARRRDALLVTANTREFRRVPGLNVEDWSESI
jgi:tRNA(fMet)-specific endonuclease VapC